MQEETRLFNLMCHSSDEGTLAIGSKAKALIGCGMAFCIKEKINKIHSLIGNDPIDYLIVDHSHYDHIGAMGHIRKLYPNIKVISHAHAAQVFNRPNALRTIRKLSQAAARDYAPESEEYLNDYSDNDFYTDIVVSQNDIISLGDLSLEVIETPGHTRDGLSFYIPELEMIKADETLGVLTGNDTMYPLYLVSYSLAKEAVKKCKAYNPKRIWSPHYGEVSSDICNKYFDLSEYTLDECKDMIVNAYNSGMSEKQIYKLFSDKYRNQNLVDKQPEDAFMLNTAVTVSTTIKECILDNKQE